MSRQRISDHWPTLDRPEPAFAMALNGGRQHRCVFREGGERCKQTYVRRSPKQFCCYLHSGRDGWQKLPASVKAEMKAAAAREDAG